MPALVEKPQAIPVKFENIPLDLKMIPRFCLWKYTLVGQGESEKWSKLPMQASGKPASVSNSATWADFLTVQKAYENGNFDGIGFVFTGDDDLIGIDIDDCRDPESGQISAFATDIINKVQGYCEISPSQTGVKIFTRSNIENAHVDHEIGLEVYSKSRYFTVTGHILGGELPVESQDITSHVPARAIKSSGDGFANYSPPLEDWDLARVNNELLSELDSMCGYTDWTTVGMALHHQFGGDVEALEAWDSWSCDSGRNKKYTTTGSHTCFNKWATFKGEGTTLRSLIFKVGQKKLKQALTSGEIVLENGNPLDHAKKFLQSDYAVEGGYRLTHYTGEFFVYKGTHYEPMEDSTVRARVYEFLSKCQRQVKQNIVPFSPNIASVNAVIDATKSIIHLENHSTTKPPVWLSGYEQGKPPANKLISMENGIFQMEERILFPHSLGFFTYNSMPFEYNPEAKCPEWEKFLNDLWGDDVQSKELLQEYFGYIISGENNQQKFLNIIGPRRSGKGTINRVLTALLGQHNVVSPQMEELCDTFALQPWVGKLLASFTDARVTSRSAAGVVSQFLRIVGNDTVTVNRKNKEAWSGYLPTRIIVYSNEMLQLAENSNALTGRMLVLTMKNSFYKKEDVTLVDRLILELAGICNWAIEGHMRRKARGGERFIQPQSSNEMLELMTEISNPMSAFMEEALVFGEGEIDKEDVFACYKHWALKKGLHPGTEISFKRRFLAATQEYHVVPFRSMVEGSRVQVYQGVSLNQKAQQYLESISSFEKEIF